MVIDRDVIEQRLKDLDETLYELGKYEEIDAAILRSDRSQRWIIERGMLVAAELIFDIANHILVAHFSTHVDTYEGTLRGLHDNRVISADLYRNLRGLGGFRNILVHRYQEVDLQQLLTHYRAGLDLFPRFAAEILHWLDEVG